MCNKSRIIKSQPPSSSSSLYPIESKWICDPAPTHTFTHVTVIYPTTIPHSDTWSTSQIVFDVFGGSDERKRNEKFRKIMTELMTVIAHFVFVLNTVLLLNFDSNRIAITSYGGRKKFVFIEEKEEKKNMNLSRMSTVQTHVHDVDVCIMCCDKRWEDCHMSIHEIAIDFCFHFLCFDISRCRYFCSAVLRQCHIVTSIIVWLKYLDHTHTHTHRSWQKVHFDFDEWTRERDRDRKKTKILKKSNEKTHKQQHSTQSLWRINLNNVQLYTVLSLLFSMCGSLDAHTAHGPMCESVCYIEIFIEHSRVNPCNPMIVLSVQFVRLFHS